MLSVSIIIWPIFQTIKNDVLWNKINLYYLQTKLVSIYNNLSEAFFKEKAYRILRL